MSKQSERAKDIRDQAVQQTREYIKTAPSPIHALHSMVDACNAMLRDRGLPAGPDHTIGDILPYFPEAPELAHELALDEYEERLSDSKKTIRAALRARGTEPAMYPPLEGIRELRDGMAHILNRLGLTHSHDDVIITHGATGATGGLLQSIGGLSHITGNNAHLLIPVPGFLLTEAKAINAGITSHRIETEAISGYCPTAEALSEALTHIPSTEPVVLSLTPVNNPTSTRYDTQTLTEALRIFRQLRPDGIILNDLAYIQTIDTASATSLLSPFRQPDISANTAHALSLSKAYAITGKRIGALVSTNQRLVTMAKNAGLLNSVGVSIDMQIDAAARLATIAESSRNSLYQVLYSRHDSVLQRLHNYQAQSSSSIHVDHDVPLYVWSSTVDVFDVFIEQGICGVPGWVFGSTQPGFARFSVGATPTTTQQH